MSTHPKRIVRIELEELERRDAPAAVVPTLGASPVAVDLIATQLTTTVALVVPGGHVVQVPPQPITPSAIQQVVLAFEGTSGYPPQPITPGPLVAAGFISPSTSVGVITGG